MHLLVSKMPLKRQKRWGSKVIGVYAVMGEYDYVAIGEFPSDEVAMAYAMALGSGGNVKTTTFNSLKIGNTVSIALSL
jgi:uncharacterized protein with GYD domain